MVAPIGLEPTTTTMSRWCSTNWATEPHLSEQGFAFASFLCEFCKNKLKLYIILLQFWLILLKIVKFLLKFFIDRCPSGWRSTPGTRVKCKLSRVQIPSCLPNSSNFEKFNAKSWIFKQNFAIICFLFARNAFSKKGFMGH